MNASNSATVTPGFSSTSTAAGSFSPLAAVVTTLTAPETVEPETATLVLVTEMLSVGRVAAPDAAGAAPIASSEPAVSAAATRARRGDGRRVQRFI